MDKTLKKHLIIHTFLFWTAVVTALCSGLIENSSGRMAAALTAGALLIVSVIWRLLFVKCPYCSSPLLECRRLPRRCPACGQDLTGRKE